LTRVSRVHARRVSFSVARPVPSPNPLCLADDRPSRTLVPALITDKPVWAKDNPHCLRPGRRARHSGTGARWPACAAWAHHPIRRTGVETSASSSSGPHDPAAPHLRWPFRAARAAGPEPRSFPGKTDTSGMEVDPNSIPAEQNTGERQMHHRISIFRGSLGTICALFRISGHASPPSLPYISLDVVPV
jgi:hypothetical protein